MQDLEAQERTKRMNNDIEVFDTVWVDMTPSPVSGYAVVVDKVLYEDIGLVMYDVRFRGSDTIYTVDKACIHQLKDKQTDKMHDKHYRDSVVEPILVMQEMFSREELIGFLKGNILKYRLRAGHKGGEETMKEDFDKICVYEKWLKTIKNGERIEL